MKRVGVVSTAFLLFMLLGVTAFGYAQHDQQGEQRGNSEKQAEPEKQNDKQQQQHAQQNRGRQQQQQKAQNQEQNKGKQQQQRAQKQQQDQQPQRAQQQPQDQNKQQQQRAQEERQNRQQPGHAQQGRTQQQRPEQQKHAQQGEQRVAWQQHRARNWESEHRTWQRRGGYNGYRIPDDYFRSYYGRNHWFRVYGLPFMVVGGYPRFQYQGYWFSFVDPYPEFWGDNWYENDDVYVDYVDDGYYLYNRRFADRPGIAISISF